MTTPELIDYIKKATDAGMTRDEVESTLLQHDWDPEDITEAYLEIEGKKNIADVAPVKQSEPAAETLKMQDGPIDISADNTSQVTEPVVDKFREPLSDDVPPLEEVVKEEPRRVDLNRSHDTARNVSGFAGMDFKNIQSTVARPNVEMGKTLQQSAADPMQGVGNMADMQNKLAMGHVPGQTFSFQAKTSNPEQIQPANSPISEPVMVSETVKPKKKSKLALLIVVLVVLLGLVAGGWFLTAGFTKLPFTSRDVGLDPRVELNNIWTASNQAMSGQVVLVDTETTYTLAQSDAVQLFLNKAIPPIAENTPSEDSALLPFEFLERIPFAADQLTISTSGVYDAGRLARQHTVSASYGLDNKATTDIRLIEDRLYIRPTLLPDAFDKNLEIQNQWYAVDPDLASSYISNQIKLPLLLEALMGDILSREVVEMSLPLILREDVTTVTKTSNPDGSTTFDLVMLDEANVMANEDVSLKRLQVSIDAEINNVTGITLSYDVPAQTGGAISIISNVKMSISAEPVNILPPQPEQDPQLTAEERELLGLPPMTEEQKPSIIDLSKEFDRYQKQEELASVEAMLLEFEFDAAEYFTSNRTFTGLCRSTSATTLTGELVKTNMSLAPLCSDTETSFVVFVAHQVGSESVYQCLDSTGFVGSISTQPVGNTCQVVL